MNATSPLIGECAGIAAVLSQLRRLADHFATSARFPPILLCGETGTGKGLVARTIHDSSVRAHGPFVDIDCAAIPETLIESELFGHERGAFTDARHTKIGLFEAADGGTLFMDEIGLLPKGPQGKVLKAVDERAVRKLGATRSKPVDVVIIAATNEDLSLAVREARFREDLYHRLTALTFVLPPLRERGDDIVLLAEHFLSAACGHHGISAKHLTRDARSALIVYHWPGNVRELANVMERVALLSDERAISAAQLRLPAMGSERSSPMREHGRTRLRESLSGFERAQLLEALAEAEGNVSLAAEKLGLPRNTLRYRIARLGLSGTSKALSAPPSRRRRRLPAGGASAADAPVLEWERRLLALLYVHLTPPPDGELSVRLSRSLESRLEKIKGFGGRVEQHGDNDFLAVFGLDPAEDAPQRAVLAAMALGSAPSNQEQSDLPRVGAVVHVSNVRVARLGESACIHPDDMLEAQQILEHLAVRAAPGSVVSSTAAAPFLHRRFELRASADDASAGLQVGRIATSEPGTTGFPNRSLSRLEGRERDLGFLDRTVEQIIAGRGQVVGLTGEPGVGKSRLLYEFQRRLEVGGVAYLEGRCPSYAGSAAYLPLVDLLRAYCSIADSDPPDIVASKVRAAVTAAGLLEAGAPYLLQLLGVAGDTAELVIATPEGIKARTFDALRRLFLARSRGAALVLAIEDLHWIDRTSEEFLAGLADGVANSRTLLLLTYRAGYRPSWIGRSIATQIALQPLTLAESLSLVQSLTLRAPLSNALVQSIVERAEGNPFFLEELARAAADHSRADRQVAAPQTIPTAITTATNQRDHRAK